MNTLHLIPSNYTEEMSVRVDLGYPIPVDSDIHNSRGASTISTFAAATGKERDNYLTTAFVTDISTIDNGVRIRTVVGSNAKFIATKHAYGIVDWHQSDYSWFNWNTDREKFARRIAEPIHECIVKLEEKLGSASKHTGTNIALIVLRTKVAVGGTGALCANTTMLVTFIDDIVRTNDEGCREFAFDKFCNSIERNIPDDFTFDCSSAWLHPGVRAKE